MNINFDNNIPIYIQLVNNLKMMIISGKYMPGEKLPSVRDLSSIVKVNPNTMQKALSELENDKLIYTERTNGKYVTNDLELINKYRQVYAEDITNKYLNNMYELGINKEEIIKLIGGE